MLSSLCWCVLLRNILCVELNRVALTYGGESDSDGRLLSNLTKDIGLAVLADVVGHLKVPKGSCTHTHTHTHHEVTACSCKDTNKCYTYTKDHFQHDNDSYPMLKYTTQNHNTPSMIYPLPCTHSTGALSAHLLPWRAPLSQGSSHGQSEPSHPCTPHPVRVCV